MQYQRGAMVLSADGQDAGKVDRLVIEPSNRQVTHLVVRKGVLLPEDKVIPVEQVRNANGNAITLTVKGDALKSLPPFEETHYIPEDQGSSATEDVNEVPLLWYPPALMGPMPDYRLAPPVIVQKNIPKGTIALKEGAKVFSHDEQRIGDIARIFTSPTDQITFFFVAHGLIQKKYKLIPANWIARVMEDEVYLSVSARLVEGLADYQDIPATIPFEGSVSGRTSMISCGEIMTREVVIALPSDSVDKIAKLMKDNDIGPVPIVQDSGSKKLVGIVTDRDLVLKVLAEGRDAKQTKAETVMTRDLITCRENDSLDNALKAMEDHQIRRISIVNNQNTLVGIVAQADVATRTDNPRRTAEVVEEISKEQTASTGA